MSELLTPLLAPIITAEPLDRGLVGEWRFDRDTGLLLPEYSGYLRQPFTIDGADWVGTEVGTGLQFVRSNTDEATADFSAITGITQSDHAFEFLIRIDATAAAFTAAFGWGDGVYWVALQVRDILRFDFSWDDDSSKIVRTSNAVTLGNWYHVFALRRGATYYLYVNAELHQSLAISTGFTVGSSTAQLGVNPWSGTDHGDITLGLLRIYNRGPSAAEVQGRYEIVTARGSGLHVSRYWDLLWGIGAPVGDVFVTPAAASAVAGRVNPTVVKGSLVLSPTPASAIGAKVDPTVIKGSLVIEPAVASAIGASVDPTVVEGGVVITPTPSSAVGAKVDPSVILGSLSISPAAAAAISSSVTPTVVLGSLVVSPAAVSAIGGKAEPTIVLGSLILTPSAASALASIQGPVVVHGSVIVTPDAVTVVAVSVDPTVFEGDVEITPEAASAIAAGVDPTVLGVGVEITPEAASAIAAAVGPIVVQGSIIISPVAVSIVVSSSGPTIYITSLARTTFVQAWNRTTDVPEWDRVTDVEGG